MKNNLNKNLLIEVKRIHEIMGVEIPIILESVISPKILSEFLVAAKSYGDNFFDLIKKESNEVKNIVNKTAFKVINLSENDINVLLKYVTKEGVEPFAEQIYKTDSLFTVKTVEGVLDSQANLVAKAEDPLEKYNQIVNSLNENKKTFFGKFNDTNPMPAHISQISDAYINIMIKNFKEVIEKKYPGIWKKIVKPGLAESEGEILKKTKGRGINVLVDAIVKALNADDWITIRRIYERMFTKEEKLKNEFIELANNANLIRMNKKDIQYEIKKMGDVLMSARKSWQDVPEEFYNQWVINNPTFPPLIRAELQKSDSRFQTVYNKVSPSTPDAFYALSLTTSAYGQLLNILKKPNWLAKSLGKNSRTGFFIIATDDAAKEAWKRWFNVVVITDPRLLEDWTKSMLSRGAAVDIAATAGARVVLHGLVVPTMIAFCKTIYGWIGSYYEQFYNYLYDTEKNFIKYNENNVSGFEAISDKFMEEMNAQFPGDKFNLLIRMVMSSLNPETMTYLDELYTIIDKTFVGRVANLDEYMRRLDSVANKSEEEFNRFIQTVPEEYRDEIISHMDSLQNSMQRPPEIPAVDASLLPD